MTTDSSQAAPEDAEVPEGASRPRRTASDSTAIDPHQGRRALMLIAPTVAVLLLVIGYPIFRAVYMSFQQDPHIANGFFVNGGFAGLDNYKHFVLQECGGKPCAPGTNAAYFWESVRITLGFTVVTVAIELVLGFWFALIMNAKFKGRALVRAAVLIPWAIPTAVTAKLWYFIFSTDGIANHVLGTHIIWFGSMWPARTAIVVADVWKTTPFMALLILAGLQLISADIYEAAKVDGASAWQRFTSITLPLARPAVMVALLFRTLDVLRMFDLPYIMTGGANHTETLSILVVQEIRTGFNSAAALSTLTFLLVFLVAFLFIKFLGVSAVDDGGEKR